MGIHQAERQPARVQPPVAEPAPAAPTPVAGARTRRRLIAMAIWVAAFAGGCVIAGIPTDPLYAFVCLWTATIAWNSHLPWRAHLRFARDWAPAVGLLVVYTLSRGYADNGVVPHVREMRDIDIRMWGWATGGRPPTVALQQRLYDAAQVRWWDVIVSFVYFSHFVVTPTVAVVLWVRDRARWAAFMRRWIALSAAGLATYFVYPAAPPWWAADHGLIGAVGRISTRGWDALGLHGAGDILNAAQLDASNPIAAMPSLHSAFALLAVAFFAPRVRRRAWPVLAAYPLAMALTLVYSGEHWVIDILVGWAYLAAVLLLVGAAEHGWARRSARRAERAAQGGEPAPATGPTPPGGGDPAPDDGTGRDGHGAQRSDPQRVGDQR